jgi:hypothetical protein
LKLSPLSPASTATVALPALLPDSVQPLEDPEKPGIETCAVLTKVCPSPFTNSELITQAKEIYNINLLCALN